MYPSPPKLAFAPPLPLPLPSRLLPPHVSPPRASLPHYRTFHAPRASAAQPPPSLSDSSPAFGRGSCLPRRNVGRYELTREGIDLKSLRPPGDEGGKFALFVAAFTVPIFVWPLISPGVSVEGPLAALVGLGMAGWAIDTLGLNGVVGRMVGVWGLDAERVGFHEAGHLLVGYLLGVKVLGYEMPSVKGVWQGSKFGVSFGEMGGDLYVGAAVGLGGVAGEVVKYGGWEGGWEDLAMVGRGGGGEGVVRWGMLVAVRLLKEHAEAHKAVCVAMREGRPLEEVLAVVEREVQRESLVGEKREVRRGETLQRGQVVL